MTQQNEPRYIIIHTSAVSYKKLKNQLNAIDSYHQSKGFPRSSLGYFVGYHRLSTDGIEYKCREDYEVGAHANNKVDGVSLNFQSLGYCMGFDGDTELPDPRDVENMKRTVREWMEKHNIPLERIKFHRHYNTLKTCPGALIGDQMIEVWFSKKEENPIMTTPQIQPTTNEERLRILETIIGLYQMVLRLLIQMGLGKVSFESDGKETEMT